MEPDPTGARTPSDDALRHRAGDVPRPDAFPKGTLVNPQTAPIPLNAEPPVPDGATPLPDEPTLEGDVAVGQAETGPLDSPGRGEPGVTVLGGAGGAVTGGVIGAALGGPVGAAIGGVVGAAAGAVLGDRAKHQPVEEALPEPRREADLEEDGAFAGGQYVGGTDRDPSWVQGAAGRSTSPAADGSPDPELRALDDPDDPRLPQDREIR